MAVEVNSSTFGNVGASYKLGSLRMRLVTLLDERTPRGNVLNQNNEANNVPSFFLISDSGLLLPL